MKKQNYARLAKDYADYQAMYEGDSYGDWYIKNHYVIKLSDGLYYEELKPSIKKDFCFGAGAYAYASDEEEASANRMVELAKSSEDYFIKENLESLNEEIETLHSYKETLKNVKDNVSVYAIKLPFVINDNSTCCLYKVEPYGDRYNQLLEKGNYRLLNDEDLDILINFYESIKEQFTKRLISYLKKYGLSKVNAWSYICD